MQADKNNLFFATRGLTLYTCTMLTASFYSKLVGVYLPGRNALFQECKDLMFHSPVFIGDILNIKGEVISIDDRFKRITIKAVIRNQHNKKVCSAKLIAGVI